MTHAANLERVSAKIGVLIIQFCAERLGKSFHAADLREYIVARIPETAPDSPSRILRELRLRGVLKYELISRAQSLYRVVRVNGQEAA